KDFARESLDKMRLLRRLRTIKDSAREGGIYINRDGRRFISFSCNDYLGLAQDVRLKQASIQAVEKYGTGSGASRLVTGNHPLYKELEEALAKIKGTEAALVFGSGYMANVGIIPALAGKGDLIVADRLVHASIIDG